MMTLQEAPLREVVIPNYIKEFIASKNVKAKHYEKGKKDIPFKYCNKHLYKTQGVREPDGVHYNWSSFPVVRQGKKKMIDFLVDTASGERIIANPNHVGTVRKQNINGQAIYNGNVARFARNNMMNQIKKQLVEHLEDVKPLASDDFPVRIFVYVFDVIIDDYTNGQDWDLDNRFFPYGKALSDTLTKLKIIPDDRIQYITEPPHPIFVPVDDPEDRKFIIRIYKDTRPVIVSNFILNRFHNRL